MKVRKSPGLDKVVNTLKAFTRDLRSRFQVSFEIVAETRQPYRTLGGGASKGSQPTNTEVMAYLAHVKRVDLWKMTPALQRTVNEAVKRGLRPGFIPNIKELLTMTGKAYLAAVADRLEQGGGDLRVRGNTAEWTQRKANLGLFTGVLKASGQLVKAIRTARVKVTGG